MLESLAAWILNNYLGKYVENLNTAQLSIAVLSGEVELENLPLRRDALRHLGLPIEVRAGHIGKVRLQIPVRQLRTAAWVIVVERLYLVAGPVPCEDSTGERASAEKLAAHDRKLAALDAIEACWRVETDSRAVPGYYAASYTSWLSYGTSVITDIVENLQLQVVDVHLRYEDSSSSSGLVVACGLTVGSLSAHTCDQDWNVGSVSQSSDRGELSFKLVELKDLSVYWDSCPVSSANEFLVSEKRGLELADAMAPSEKLRKYLVAPVSARARLQRNRSDRPLRGSNEPRVVCDLKLDEVPLSIDELQYDQIIACSRGLELSSRAQQRRALRPNSNPTQNAHEWWLYAIRHHLPHFHPRSSWSSCLKRARENIRYVQIYSALLSKPVSSLSSDERSFKDNIEWNRDLLELQSLREIAMRRTPAGEAAATKDKGCTHGLSTLMRWFPQWWGWKMSVVEPEVEGGTKEDRRLLEEQILAALADSALDSTVLRRDAVFGRFNFELSSGAVKLCENSTTMLEFQFTELCLSLESKPRSASLTVELSLGGICLRDSITSGSLFPVLVGVPETDRTRIRATTRQTASTAQSTPKHKLRKPTRNSLNFCTSTDSSNGLPLFHLVYSSGPGSEHRLHVHSRPLDVVYQPAAARWLVEFLCAPHQRIAARRRLRDMGARTRHGLAERWGHVLRSGQSKGDGRTSVLLLAANIVDQIEADKMENRSVEADVVFGDEKVKMESCESSADGNIGGATSEVCNYEMEVRVKKEDDLGYGDDDGEIKGAHSRANLQQNTDAQPIKRESCQMDEDDSSDENVSVPNNIKRIKLNSENCKMEGHAEAHDDDDDDDDSSDSDDLGDGEVKAAKFEKDANTVETGAMMAVGSCPIKEQIMEVLEIIQRQIITIEIIETELHKLRAKLLAKRSKKLQ